ncbi:hypothetical protein Acr_18g0007710 [Actinidia rufa]|uniref:Uncharacterized protein n=1 Tax=Actinidia rufa TaxID=165716 RepID=A0A7J0G745_9ERIC|nr:hypothetical protein Acr_18g0007710 [Actinidia rufa]
MELNSAQLLVYNNEALERFMAKHDIPIDFQIEHPGPNEVTHLVEGNEDHILVSVNFVRTVLEVDTLMRQMKLPFSAEDLLHVYTIVRPMNELGTPFFIGKITYASGTPVIHRRDFNNKFKCRFEDYKKAIQVVSNRKVSRKVADVLKYEPIYWHMIPHKAEEPNMINLPPLHIEERVPWGDASNLKREAKDSNVSLEETNMVKFKTLGQKKKTMPAADPPTIEAPSSGKKETVKVPSKRSKTKARGTSSPVLHSSDADAELWKLEFAAIKLGRQVIVVDSTKDRDTSLSLTWVVMLPKDVTNSAEESSDAASLEPPESCNHLKPYEGLVFNRGINQVRDNYYRKVAELCPWDLHRGVARLLNSARHPRGQPRIVQGCFCREIAAQLAKETAQPIGKIAAQLVEEAASSQKRDRVNGFRILPLGTFCCHGGLKAVEGSGRCPLEIVGLVGFPFKATNSPVADKKSVTVLPMSDIAEFSLVKKCCREA